MTIMVRQDPSAHTTLAPWKDKLLRRPNMKKLLVITPIICIAMLLTSELGALVVPHYLNYHSRLYDDGGNLMADGSTGITFKISDPDGNILFEEYQTVNIVNGIVSALIGNGVDENNAPSGGIPPSVLTPDNSRYLEVTVDNYSPEGPLEIVSVPYAVYAEKAYSVADGSVNGASLANKSITMEHLTDDLISEIGNELSGGRTIATTADITNVQNTYSSTSGATNIGVTRNFNYSASNNVQEVLQDLDLAVRTRQVEIEALGGDTGSLNLSIPPIGSIIPFYDFNGALTFDATRWAYCDGSTRIIEGLGEQTLPDLSNRYLVGFGTEGGGDIDTASWTTASIGNTSHQVNLQHTHEVNISSFASGAGSPHSHYAGTLQFQVADWNDSTGFFFNSDGSFSTTRFVHANQVDSGSERTLVELMPSAEENFYTANGTGSTNDESSHLHTIDPPNTTSTNSLSTTQSIQPRSVRVRYIMRIR